MTIDPVHPGTQFTGYSHVWRALDNGGNQAFLEANCTAFEVFFQGNFSSSCGKDCRQPLRTCYGHVRRAGGQDCGPVIHRQGYGEGLEDVPCLRPV